MIATFRSYPVFVFCNCLPTLGDPARAQHPSHLHPRPSSLCGRVFVMNRVIREPGRRPCHISAFAGRYATRGRLWFRSLSSKLAFRQPTWTASCGRGAVATSPQNSWKTRRIRSQRFQYPRIVQGSSRAQFGPHPAAYGTCCSRGRVASMESVTYAVRDTRPPANLDNSEFRCNSYSCLNTKLRS
jgi:hypothetical protein